MVNSVFGHERAPRELAETIHRQTERNPLFVQEVLRYFVEEGLMERDGSQLRRVGEEGLADKVPEGLRDVIGRRLTKLSPEANQALSIASVIGRDFTLDVLRRVADLPALGFEPRPVAPSSRISPPEPVAAPAYGAIAVGWLWVSTFIRMWIGSATSP